MSVQNAYLDGGDFTWHNLDADQSVIFQFGSNGTYQELQAQNGQMLDKGNFLFLNDSTLSFQSALPHPPANNIRAFQQTAGSLILDQQVTEGVIRSRFVSVP